MLKRQIVFGLVLGIGIIWLACSKPSQRQMLFNGKDFTGWKLFIPGDSVDVKDVWSVQDGVVRCTGVPTGYMRTLESFSNYKLHLEWRWAGEPGNSGVLLHCQGPDQVWPNCIEAQLKSGNAGDFVIIGPGSITVDGKEYKNTEEYLIIKRKTENVEKPIGEWNSYDIVCKGDEITLYVNGTLVNKGSNAFATSGPIALQSEGAPIEFRNIYLEPLK